MKNFKEGILIFDKGEFKVKNIRQKEEHKIRKYKHHEHKNTSNVASKYIKQQLTKLLEEIN